MLVYLETFGCQMNELDSELVHSQLSSLGYQFVDRPEDAQVVLYNTCSVREQAEQKAYSRIGIIGQRKKAGERIILGVIGCMAERDGVDMMRRHPQVDLLCGPAELDRLPQLIDNARTAAESVAREDMEAARVPAHPRADRVALAGNKTRRTATLAAAEDNLEALDLSRSFQLSGEHARRPLRPHGWRDPRSGQWPRRRGGRPLDRRRKNHRPPRRPAGFRPHRRRGARGHAGGRRSP